jgi:vacuolar protein sorting-associated protein 54
VDWSVPKPGGGVNDYMEILVKETVTLHKVLSRYLSPPVVEVSVSVPFLFFGAACSMRWRSCDYRIDC